MTGSNKVINVIKGCLNYYFLTFISNLAKSSYKWPSSLELYHKIESKKKRMVQLLHTYILGWDLKANFQVGNALKIGIRSIKWMDWTTIFNIYVPPIGALGIKVEQK
jgi:hypothetical protein